MGGWAANRPTIKASLVLGRIARDVDPREVGELALEVAGHEALVEVDARGTGAAAVALHEDRAVVGGVPFRVVVALDVEHALEDRSLLLELGEGAGVVVTIRRAVGLIRRAVRDRRHALVGGNLREARLGSVRLPSDLHLRSRVARDVAGDVRRFGGVRDAR